MAKAAYQPRLRTVYEETIRKALLEQFKYEAAAVIAAAMLIVSFALLFLINLLQRRLNWRAR